MNEPNAPSASGMLSNRQRQQPHDPPKMLEHTEMKDRFLEFIAYLTKVIYFTKTEKKT